jgi:rubrerythrin
MTFLDSLTLVFMKQMLRTPKGRAHFLTQVADAENNDEGAIFAALKTRTSDPQLQRMVTRHAADEERHAQILLERADAQGLPRPVIPEHLKLLHRLDEALGGLVFKPIETNEDVMRMYLVLQVIEERAVNQFWLFQRALRDFDPKSADVFDSIEADEQRHLKYCHAIARRYAPSAQMHEETLARFRDVEAKVFAQNTLRNLNWALQQGLLEVSAPMKAAWWALGRVTGALNLSRPTRFMNSPLASGAAELSAA